MLAVHIKDVNAKTSMGLRLFENVGPGKFLPIFTRDVSEELKEVALMNSACKQLLEELSHAQRGHEEDHLGHVRRDLDTLIVAIKHAKTSAHHADKAWHHFVKPLRARSKWMDEVVRSSEHEEQIYLQFLTRIRASLETDARDYPKLKSLLELLREYTNTLHDRLLSVIRAVESKEYERAAYGPPNHHS